MTRHRTLIRLSAVLAVLALVWACGGDSPTAPPTPESVRPTTVTVSPATAELTALGETVQLTATARDQNGQVMSGATVTWSSSDARVATVDTDGLVTAVGEGAATITAMAGQASGSAAVAVSAVAVSDPDRAALVALYKATGGKYWTNRDNWLSDVPLKDWYGVEVNAEGRVISLELLENGLVGHLPPELGDLAELEGLELYDNGLTGAIPPEFGSLPNLQRLDVGGNRLTGSIPPELGNLSKLEWLELGHNGLTGSIPPELGNLSELRRIWIGNNNLQGPIPPELGKLSSLRDLWLGGAYLTGPIPPELGQLTHLRRLYLKDNRLTGGVPPELGNLSNLEDLELERNQLTGTLPMSVLRITGLEFLQIQENAGLCVPGTTDFVEWAGAIDDREGLFCNQADRTALDSLYAAAGGTNWTNAGGWRGEGAVGDRHGVSADSLGRVLELDLAGNGLAGVVPPELGDLGHMTVLKLGGNDLSGRLPQSLARLPLREFRYADTELCVPPAAAFRAWLDGIAVHEGAGDECAPISDRAALVALYEATDGPNWTNSENWLTHAPLKDWYGVEVNAEGRVISLDLYRNGLVGELPAELVNLAALEHLELGRNGLTGAIPPEFGSLPNLQSLELDRNRLTGPIPPELGGLSSLWRLDVGENRLTGPIPPELGNLSELRRMYLDGNELTGPIPPELGRLSGLETLYLGYNPLSGPIPSELGNLSNLRYLRLGRDAAWTYPYANKGRPPVLGARYPALTGPIPPELGRLTNLDELDLGWHDLTGPIPPELGNLSELRKLRLESNRLSGSIPTEIGNISSLTRLLLAKNDLTGPVPSTIGDLSSLKQLVLSRNELTGALPLELGRLADLENLDLEYNGLSGTLPPELGWLAELEHLILNFNALTGSLPAELSGLASLRRMGLTGNTGMSGALPNSLTALDQLEDLAVGSTELCAPGGAEFAGWLAALSSAYVAPCGIEPAVAYLTQAVQSRQIPVPLVAGRRRAAAGVRHGPACDDRRHPAGPGAHLYRRSRDACRGDPGQARAAADRSGRRLTRDVSLRGDPRDAGPARSRDGGRDRPRRYPGSVAGGGPTHSGNGQVAGGRPGDAEVPTDDRAVPLEGETRFHGAGHHPGDGRGPAEPRTALEDEHPVADRRRLRPDPARSGADLEQCIRADDPGDRGDPGHGGIGPIPHGNDDRRGRGDNESEHWSPDHRNSG